MRQLFDVKLRIIADLPVERLRALTFWTAQLSHWLEVVGIEVKKVREPLPAQNLTFHKQLGAKKDSSLAR